MKIKFIHLRRIINNEVAPHGGMTIAYLIDDNFNVIGFAPAKCHKHDNYSRKQGRVKAEGRLKSNRYFVQLPPTEEKKFLAKATEMYAGICKEDARRFVTGFGEKL